MSLLSLDRLTVHRGTCPVVDTATLRIEAGELVGLIGPNGAGKTTLMRGALGLLPHTGSSSLTAMTPRARAGHAAWLPQAREIAWPVAVETLVTLGRTPHLAAGQRPGAADRAAVARALATMDLSGFERRAATELSGGEQARVLIARALAQDTPLILADEPIAGLDPRGTRFATDGRLCAAVRAAGGKALLVSLPIFWPCGAALHPVIRDAPQWRSRRRPPEAVLTEANLAQRSSASPPI